MEIIQYENQRQNILLTKDYRPNPAMINEFQTNFFTCKLERIELAGKEIEGYIVDEGAQFLILHLQIKNMTNEIVKMYQNDFTITCDKESPFEAESYFDIPHQLPNEFALKPLEVVKGSLIFIIGSSTKKIMLGYTEYFDDESDGKTYKLKYMIK